ncbi:putative beta-galactosidase-like [Capsicum annuum]|nr:putative beta-galactosidase-like [Capsicum annuum]
MYDSSYPSRIDSIQFVPFTRILAKIESQKVSALLCSHDAEVQASKSYLVPVVGGRGISRDVKHGSWLLGGGWNNDIWGGDLPMASWIDSITPHNPVWLTRMDGHMGLANTLALTLAGISRINENPNGGAIVRNNDREALVFLYPHSMGPHEYKRATFLDLLFTVLAAATQFQTFSTRYSIANTKDAWYVCRLDRVLLIYARSTSAVFPLPLDLFLSPCYSLLTLSSLDSIEPTGLLIDSAMKLVLPHIPDASVDERREALLRASDHALKRGVTTVVDFGRYFPGSLPEYPWQDFSGFSSDKK